MILYRLRCANDHTFEAWFKDSATYDLQVKAGEVACAYCGDAQIGKAPMAPRVIRGRGEPAAAAEPQGDNPEKGGRDRAEALARQIIEALGELRDDVEKTCEDVGENFAEEARAIHYGEADQRGIYGKATQQETEALAEEGIEFHRLPLPLRRRTS